MNRTILQKDYDHINFFATVCDLQPRVSFDSDSQTDLFLSPFDKGMRPFIEALSWYPTPPFSSQKLE